MDGGGLIEQSTLLGTMNPLSVATVFQTRACPKAWVVNVLDDQTLTGAPGCVRCGYSRIAVRTAKVRPERVVATTTHLNTSTPIVVCKAGPNKFIADRQGAQLQTYTLRMAPSF